MKNLILLWKLILLRISERLAAKWILPVSYTVSVTSRCNSRCKTCNIYKKKSPELAPEEYEKIFKTIGGSAYWVTISGGEPFLRKDLFDIVYNIYKCSKPKVINIPTNGLLYKQIPEVVKRIATHCPCSTIVVNVSIDEIGKRDDAIRGARNAYSSAIKTFNQLRRLNLKNLNIGIHTVISKFNVDNFREVAGTLIDMKPDSYITEIAENRVELGTENADISPPYPKYAQAIDYLLFTIKNRSFKGMNRITQALRIEYYNLVKKIIREQKAVIKCYAGILTMQIAPNGDVWPCCMLAKEMGNLKDYNYNFKKLWSKNQALQKERQRIRQEKCFCPMANASYTNMLMNNKIAFRVIRHLLKKEKK
jgi:MoaA/NifB/PqqE/SkfB family radical SAM enzyme